jgi:hypothetical protein
MSWPFGLLTNCFFKKGGGWSRYGMLFKDHFGWRISWKWALNLTMIWMLKTNPSFNLLLSNKYFVIIVSFCFCLLNTPHHHTHTDRQTDPIRPWTSACWLCLLKDFGSLRASTRLNQEDAHADLTSDISLLQQNLREVRVTSNLLILQFNVYSDESFSFQIGKLAHWKAEQDNVPSVQAYHGVLWRLGYWRRKYSTRTRYYSRELIESALIYYATTAASQ